MSLSQKLKLKLQEAKQYLTVQELPNEIKLKLVKSQFKEDKRGNECLYLTLQTADNKTIVQKYPKSTWATLYEIILPIYNKLETEFCTWHKAKIGQAINERLIPKITKKEK